MASGKGFEPLFAGSEPTVLPIRRPRSEFGRDGGARTRYLQLEKLIARLFAFIPVKNWKRRKDSNLHQLVSKTSASAGWATRAYRFGMWDFGFRVCVVFCSHEIRNPHSQIRNQSGPGSRIRTCEHLLPRQAHVALCGTPG